MNRQQAFFLATTGLLAAVGVLMVAPFGQYLLAGALLAFVTRPVHRRLASRLPASIAAAVVVGLTVVFVVLPVLAAIAAVADEAAALAAGASLDQLPTVGEAEALIRRTTGRRVDVAGRLEALIETVARWAAGSVSGIVGAAVSAAIGVSLMLVVQFYTVRDWDQFSAWTKTFDLLPTTVQDRVYGKTALATWSVVKGHVFVAVLQGVAAGIGLWIVGIPDVFLWTFLMVILGFIPMVGSAMVWAPAGLYLVATGEVLSGAGLLAYGLVLIGSLDNLARPILVDESVDLNDLFVLLGVIGGVSLFGPIGIFLGPVIYAVLGELLDVYNETYTDLSPAT